MERFPEPPATAKEQARAEQIKNNIITDTGTRLRFGADAIKRTITIGARLLGAAGVITLGTLGFTELWRSNSAPTPEATAFAESLTEPLVTTGNLSAKKLACETPVNSQTESSSDCQLHLPVNLPETILLTLGAGAVITAVATAYLNGTLERFDQKIAEEAEA